MATAEVVEIERTSNVTPQGDIEDVLRPVFTLSTSSGTFRTEGIPVTEFSRDLARSRITALATELVAEGEDISVTFPSET